MGKLVTFYSYKGGVGRTMALANVAVSLAAHGQRVLAIDWDLEAPGLDRFFRNLPSDRPSNAGGMLSLFDGFRMEQSVSWKNLVTTIRLSPEHRLSFLASGVGVPGYESRILDLDWNQFYEKGGGDFLESIREEWENEFDFVLIDSRTGLTDSGGICTIQMPDILVTVFTATDQSISGVKGVAQRARKGRQKLPFPRLAMPVLPIISRWDGQAEELEGEEWMNRIEKEMREFLSLWVPADASLREALETLRVPHSPFFSFGEKLPVLLQDSLTDDQKPAEKYFNVAALLLNHDWSSIKRNSTDIRKSVERMRRIVGANRRRRVYVSAVSKEFETHRRLLTKSLSSFGIEVVAAESFGADHFLTLGQLESAISECDAVIHLIGLDTGNCPEFKELEAFLRTRADISERLMASQELSTGNRELLSFTQWEYHFALQNCVPIFPFVADYVRDERTARENEAFDRQIQHLRSVQRSSQYSVFRSPEDLVIQAQRVLQTRRPTNLPVASLGNLFKGREQVLETLHSPTEMTRSPVVLSGLGGVGKTRLAVEYGWRYATEYSATLFVTANSPAALARNLATLAGPLVLGLPEAQDAREVEVQVAAVMRWLERHTGWLLILDSVDDDETAQEVDRMIAHLQGGKILVTSRIARWSNRFQPVELDVLATDTSIAFLLESTAAGRQTRDDDDASAMKIVSDLGGLPLALEQAAAYIVELGLSFSQYRQRWESKRQQVLSWCDSRTTGFPASVAAVWETTFTELKPDSRVLLDHVAFFAPDPIPTLLFEDSSCANIWAELLGTDDAHLTLADLRRYSVIRRAENSITIHRLVQTMLRHRLPPDEKRRCIEGALRILDTSSPGDPNDVRTWDRWKLLAPHFEAATAFAEEFKIAQPTAKLLNNVAQYVSARGSYLQAEMLMRRALAIEEVSFGPNHPEVSRDLNNLAALLYSTNRISEAEPLMRRALSIEEECYGSEHPRVATSLSNLAQLLQATNRLAEAEPLMRRALMIDEQSYGEPHPNVSAALNNLAALLQATNRMREAEPLMRRALVIDEQSYGSQHPNVAIRLNNLAQLLLATNRPEEAEPLMRRVVTIFEQCLGDSHPNIATALNNLAQLLQVTDRVEEAEPLIRRSIAIDEYTLGTDHPRVASALNNLAQLLIATGRFAEAEPLLRRSLNIEHSSFGYDHPSVAARLSNLSQLLSATGRIAEAEPLARQAAEILLRFAKNSGNQHPHLESVVRNYATVLSTLGSDDEEVSSRINALLSSDRLPPKAKLN